MQEKAYGSLRSPGFDQPRQQHQVIIMNPQDVIGSDDVFQRIAEDLVDLFVLLPVVELIFGESRKVVNQLPLERDFDRAPRPTDPKMFHTKSRRSSARLHERR